MSSNESTRFVSGGYFIARPRPRGAGMNAELLPGSLVTASGCCVDLVPETWTITWTVDTREQRTEDAARFGMNAEQLEALTAWATAALDTGELGWPGVFFDAQTAAMVRDRFLPSRTDTVLFGIALPVDLRERFLEETRPLPGQEPPGVVAAVQAAVAPHEGGTQLGFDVLGWDHGFHSYVCNGLESEFQRVFGVRPNRHGFYDTEPDARRCAEHAGLETTAAEPCLWLPWQVRRYDELGDELRG